MFPNQTPAPAPPPQEPQQAPTPNPFPDQSSAGPTLPTDYLNQIAPQAPKKSLMSLGIKQLALIGAALVILVIILSVVVNSIAGGKHEPIERLATRINATQEVIIKAQANLKSSELRSLNSNLKLYMTNTTRDMTAPVASAGINVAKISKNIIASESTDALSVRLENARLNAVFDRTYAREMAYQLGTLMTLMTEIYNSSSNEQLKTFLKSAYDSLKPTQESFANFTAAS